MKKEGPSTYKSRETLTMCYETKKSAQKTTRNIHSSETEWLKIRQAEKSGGIRPHKREKAPEGLFGDAGALGAAQRLGK